LICVVIIVIAQTKIFYIEGKQEKMSDSVCQNCGQWVPRFSQIPQNNMIEKLENQRNEIAETLAWANNKIKQLETQLKNTNITSKEGIRCNYWEPISIINATEEFLPQHIIPTRYMLYKKPVRMIPLSEAEDMVNEAKESTKQQIINAINVLIDNYPRRSDRFKHIEGLKHLRELIYGMSN